MLLDRRLVSAVPANRKDDYNWRYDNEDLSEDIIRASNGIENIQLDRKARNLTTSWRYINLTFSFLNLGLRKSGLTLQKQVPKNAKYLVDAFFLISYLHAFVSMTFHCLIFLFDEYTRSYVSTYCLFASAR